MVDLTVFVVAALAFSLLALSQKRHWHAITGQKTRPFRKLRYMRFIAILMCCMSFIHALMGSNTGFTVLTWILTQSAAAIAIALLLAYFPGLFLFLAGPLKRLAQRKK